MRNRSLPGLALAFSISSAALGANTPASQAQPAPRMDYSIPMEALQPKDASIQNYRNRWTLFFYFLPTCGHCHRAYPAIQRIHATYGKKGLAVAAIASASSREEDLRQFGGDLGLDMPLFRDATRQFGQSYGTGSVPLLVLAAPDGTFRSWVGFDEHIANAMDSSIRTGLHIK